MNIFESIINNNQKDTITEVSDTLDDAIVVVDPDLSLDDLDDHIQDLSDMVDSTADNEVVSVDDYVGDHIYACPICGNNFLSAEYMSEHEECPVCGDEPDGFVFIGDVAKASENDEDESTEDLDDSQDDEESESEESIDDLDESVILLSIQKRKIGK